MKTLFDEVERLRGMLTEYCAEVVTEEFDSVLRRHRKAEGWRYPIQNEIPAHDCDAYCEWIDEDGFPRSGPCYFSRNRWYAYVPCGDVLTVPTPTRWRYLTVEDAPV